MVNEGRRLLLEWLIRTTRVKTVWPPMGAETKGAYATAGDGKEASSAGPSLRARKGSLNYI